MLGLVLEGGASRTMFSSGVTDGMLDIGLICDYVIGVSAGISYGVSYVSRQMGRNMRIAEEYMQDKRYMGARHLLSKNNKSYYNLDFVFDSIPNKYVPFDYDTYGENDKSSIAVVTDIESGNAEYLPVLKEDRKFLSLRASCAMPFLFPPIKIDGKLYMDGGISDSIPFEKAFSDGCDKVIVVLTRERDFVKKKEPIFALANLWYAKYPRMVQQLKTRHIRYNESLDKLRKLENEGKALIIAPNTTYGIGRTERRAEKLRVIYNDGFNTAVRDKDQLLEFANSAK